MAEITKVYRQTLPAVKLVGRCYGEAEKVNGTFSHKWGEWFQNDLFAPLRMPESAEPFADCDAYYGFSRCREGEPCQYWIGALLPPDAPVPEGYESAALPAGDVAVCWVRGREPDIYFVCCLSRLAQEGFEWAADADGYRWCFERYVHPRFTEPDADGCVTLDMCFYVK